MLTSDFPVPQRLQAEHDRLRPRPQRPRIPQVRYLLHLGLREAEPEQPPSLPAGTPVHARLVRPPLGPPQQSPEQADRAFSGASWHTFCGIVT